VLLNLLIRLPLVPPPAQALVGVQPGVLELGLPIVVLLLLLLMMMIMLIQLLAHSFLLPVPRTV
jgi:hypothetical protein